MAETRLKIKRWGNNLGVRLPAAIARAAHLEADQPVIVSVEGNQIVIRPETSQSMTLDERLEAFDPDIHGGEVMRTDAIGNKRW
ncbi:MULTISPECIES: AbrB/MazE/SpoVT family DNA-binding domain-containing protein [unclassified Thioalkalivibrio]|uniref:AbrB/MazE/SpoVT family DNA-binding domain-containing protein n=1 Tax=unclassified Thioalkalivibrio TaxID=2621013 RepID=UPI0003725A83|nr:MULTISPECIES: AbrB/MazE/SpoVT family DNA-binding domain-containing protein [unclassified Thioalkalivibrio]